MTDKLIRLREDEGGQDIVEYSLLAGFIGLVCLTALMAAGNSINSVWLAIKTWLDGITSLIAAKTAS